jgi:uncharacterized protein YraI
MNKNKIKQSLILLLFSIIAPACGPAGSLPDSPGGAPLPGEVTLPASAMLYVSMDGDDGNDCLSPGRSCRTLRGAVDKAGWMSEIHIAPGSYQGGLLIRKSISLVGESSSPAQILGRAAPSPEAPNLSVAGNQQVRLANLQIVGHSTPLDFKTAHGLVIEERAFALLENVSFQNNQGNAILNMGTLHYYGGSAAGNASGISTATTGTSEIRDVEIRSSSGSNFGTIGVLNRGESHLERVTIHDNLGNGVVNGEGSLSINGGEISGNDGYGLFIYDGEVEVVGAHIHDHSFPGVRIENGHVTLTRAPIDNDQKGLEMAGGEAEVIGGVIRDNREVGALVTAGQLTIRDAQLTANGSGGISLNGGLAALSHTRIDGHTSYGVAVGAARLVMKDVQITGNGTGILNQGGEVRADGLAVNSNEDQGVGNRNGLLNLLDAQIMGNGAEGLLQYGEAGSSRTAETTLERAVIANNGREGINMQDGTLSATNVTVSGNQRGGVSAASSVRLTFSFSTIAYNDGEAGLILGPTARAALTNSIVALNDPAHGDCRGGPTLAGFNLACSETLTGAVLRLGTLTADSDTFVHPLLAGSPALDAATGDCPGEDQRSAERPAGAACDVGAYEANGRSLSVPFEPLLTPGIDFPPVTPAGTPLALSAPSVTFTKNANCRKGPGTQYHVVTSFEKGKTSDAGGRNDEGTWWSVLNPSGGSCWVSDSTVEKAGVFDGLQVLAPPPLPDEPSGFFDKANCSPNLNDVPVKLSWGPATGATGYRLYRNGNLLATLKASATAYTDTASKGKGFTYEIESINEFGASQRLSTTVSACK